jgi:hypothetical protein
MAWHGSSRRGADRRVVIGYQGAAAALLVALAAVGLAEAPVAHNASSTEPVLTVALCAVLVGIACYLGRTRPAPGMGRWPWWNTRATACFMTEPGPVPPAPWCLGGSGLTWGHRWGWQATS